MRKIFAGLVLVALIILTTLVHAVLFVPIMVLLAWSDRYYIRQWWLSMDQHLNVMLGGDKDEYLSSRIGKAIHYGAPEPEWFMVCFARPLFWLLHWFDFNHCWNSIDWTEGHWKWTSDLNRPDIKVPPFPSPSPSY